MKLGTLLRITDTSEANAKFAELKKYGFDKVLDIYQAAYDRYMSKLDK